MVPHTNKRYTTHAVRSSASMSCQLSPQRQFAHRSVLLTGGLGFLGGVVLEQLLRKTEVEKVYVLVRARKQHSALQRMQQQLSSPLFHLLQEQALQGGNVFSKVHVVEGDLLLPGLGLSAADQQLLRQVHIVLHCAASLELKADIQKTLRNNYVGTQQLMQLASDMPDLAAFVHVSTYYVANHLPRNATVKESLHPLQLSLDGRPANVEHAEFVSALLAMLPGEANALAGKVMQANSFGSTYAFGKSLTEQLVVDTVIKPGLAKAVVRPSLITSLAGSPYPGFLQGYAGPNGYAAGYGMGFLQGLSSVAHGSDQVVDLIPCDIVAALLIAAAGAAAADSEQASAAASSSTTFYHASSSSSFPLSLTDAFDIMADYWTANQPPLRLPLTKYVRITRSHIPTPHGLECGRLKAARKAKLLAALMQLAGKRQQAQKLLMGVKSFAVHNSLPLAASMVCAVDNVVALRDRIAQEERQLWPMLWARGEPTTTPWRMYFLMFLSAVRQLVLGMQAPDSTRTSPASCFQVILPAVSSEQVASLMLGASGNCNSSLQGGSSL